MSIHRVYLFLTTLLLIVLGPSVKAQQTDIYGEDDFITVFELDNNRTVTYDEGMDYWRKLSKAKDEVTLLNIGKSDIGKSLHLVVLHASPIQHISELYNTDKLIIFINNAIHPGEPCGVDATMMLYRDIVFNKDKSEVLDEIILVSVPFYNIGGVLNRNTTSRANQNGPKSYGFRGNAQNLDLNRDFIKTDSKNAAAFNKIFSRLRPHIFLDTHTTNGADYQHVMTLISSMPEHYDEPLKSLYEEKLVPYLYEDMKEKGFPMSPYVDMVGQTPFEGLYQFNDTPRYSQGYASLFNSLVFTSEAHMLKTYKERVEATYKLMESLINWSNENAEEVLEAREAVDTSLKSKSTYNLLWEIDTTNYKEIEFLGYDFDFKPSEVSGLNRLYYDRTKPRNENIKFYHKNTPTLSIDIPSAYIIPQAYSEVIERLKNNNIELTTINWETTINVEAYKIVDYKTVNKVYEGHYLHYDIQVEKINLTRDFHIGDVMVSTDQKNLKYIIETLEPQASDSFFAWNFFDAILGQKEYFSAYLYEDEAAKLLDENPTMREELDNYILENPEAKESAWMQLYFIYKKSDSYETTHNLYPIFRLN